MCSFRAGLTGPSRTGINEAPVSSLKCSRELAFAVLVLVDLTFAGCATRKAPGPPPSYPAVPESAIQELRHVPSGAYDKLEVATIEAEVGPQLLSAMESVRQSAAQKGANAIVILREAEFSQKVGKRRLKVRRISYLVIHRR